MMEPLTSVLEVVAPSQEMEPSIPVSRVEVTSEEVGLLTPVSESVPSKVDAPIQESLVTLWLSM